MLTRVRQAGFMQLEILLLLAMFVLISVHALPQAAKFYRQIVVEYEAEQLLSSIRYCQNISRITAENAWGYGAKKPIKRSVYLKLMAEHSEVFAGGRDIIATHDYLPGVNVVKVYQEKGVTRYETPVKLDFSANGRPLTTGMMTLLIYYQGHPVDGQKIMISKGGRIRMERDARER